MEHTISPEDRAFIAELEAATLTPGHQPDPAPRLK
jgi:hypothetical protein